MMTPEEYQQMLDLGGQNEQLAAQAEMAKSLRSPLRTRGTPGGYQVAPHWTELLSNIGNQYAEQKATRKQGSNKSAQHAMLLRALLGQQQTQNPAVTQYPNLGDEAM